MTTHILIRSLDRGATIFLIAIAAVAVVVPARHAYSHCASVGSRNSQSFGNFRCF